MKKPFLFTIILMLSMASLKAFNVSNHPYSPIDGQIQRNETRVLETSNEHGYPCNGTKFVADEMSFVQWGFSSHLSQKITTYEIQPRKVTHELNGYWNTHWITQSQELVPTQHIGFICSYSMFDDMKEPLFPGHSYDFSPTNFLVNKFDFQIPVELHFYQCVLSSDNMPVRQPRRFNDVVEEYTLDMVLEPRTITTIIQNYLVHESSINHLVANLDVENVFTNSFNFSELPWYDGHNCIDFIGSETNRITIFDASCNRDGESVVICPECMNIVYCHTPRTRHSTTNAYFSATCTEGSGYRQICTNCEQIINTVYTGEPNGHSMVDIKSVLPTCKTFGRTDGQVCTVCNYQIGGEDISPLSGNLQHTWYLDQYVDGENEQYWKLKCRRCSAYYDSIMWDGMIGKNLYLNSDNEFYSDYSYDSLPEGSRLVASSDTILNEWLESKQLNLDYQTLDLFNSVDFPHRFTNVVTNKPTCTNDGFVVGFCVNEQKWKQIKYASMLPHKYRYVQNVKETCTNGGEYYIQCSECGFLPEYHWDYSKQDYVIDMYSTPKMGHLFKDWSVDYKWESEFYCYPWQLNSECARCTKTCTLHNMDDYLAMHNPSEDVTFEREYSSGLTNLAYGLNLDKQRMEDASIEYEGGFQFDEVVDGDVQEITNEVEVQEFIQDSFFAGIGSDNLCNDISNMVVRLGTKKVHKPIPYQGLHTYYIYPECAYESPQWWSSYINNTNTSSCLASRYFVSGRYSEYPVTSLGFIDEIKDVISMYADEQDQIEYRMLEHAIDFKNDWSNELNSAYFDGTNVLYATRQEYIDHFMQYFNEYCYDWSDEGLYDENYFLIQKMFDYSDTNVMFVVDARKCQNCINELKISYDDLLSGFHVVDADEHEWTNFSIVSNRTCTKSEIIERRCLKCGAVESRNTLPPFGHDFEHTDPYGKCVIGDVCRRCGYVADSITYNGLIYRIDDGNAVCSGKVLFPYEPTESIKVEPVIQVLNGTNIVNKFVVEIGKKAFYDNNDIKRVELPPQVKIIRENAFGFCGYLNEINLENVRVIEDEAFFFCNIDTLNLNQIEYIGDDAFGESVACNHVNIGKNVKYIGYWAFWKDWDDEYIEYGFTKPEKTTVDLSKCKKLTHQVGEEQFDKDWFIIVK